MILETKGYDPLEEVKRAAVLRWIAAVNADGQHGLWAYELVKNPESIPTLLAEWKRKI